MTYLTILFLLFSETSTHYHYCKKLLKPFDNYKCLKASDPSYYHYENENNTYYAVWHKVTEALYMAKIVYNPTAQEHLEGNINVTRIVEQVRKDKHIYTITENNGMMILKDFI